MSRSARNTVIIGDAEGQLRRLPAGSVDMVLTSPPYYRLRNYGIRGQLGDEASVGQWVDNLAAVAREVRPLLTPTGSFWLNVGDSYAVRPADGAARKSLLLAPERLALRLTAEGWCLRNKIVWRKSNPMPTSVIDRLACTWESLFVFVKQPRYFFDLDAIRVPHSSRSQTSAAESSSGRRPIGPSKDVWRGRNAGSTTGLARLKALGQVGHPLGKNPGDVWVIASSNQRGPHPATYPVALAERAILAGCPEARCVACRTPWRRSVTRELGRAASRGLLAPSCECAAAAEPGLVLDPFIGSGTTAVAAEANGRDWLGIELNPAYARLAAGRVHEARASPDVA